MGSEKVKEATDGPIDFAHPLAAHVKIEDRDDGRVVCRPQRNIAIVGFADSSRRLAPFDDPEWEIWGMNQLYRHIPRADRWFEIHANYADHVVEGTDHCSPDGWLAKSEIPIYMVERQPAYPNSVTYPLGRIMDYFGVDYFTSSIAFMTALAIYELTAEEHLARTEPKASPQIGLWGIDLIVGTEYFHQKACVEFFLGYGHAKGLTMVLPETSALLKQSHRYGYQLEPEEGLIKESELDRRRAQLNKEKNQKVIDTAYIDGAIQENLYWANAIELRKRMGTYPMAPPPHKRTT